MNKNSQLSGKYLGTITSDFVKISDNLKETSYQIRSRKFSKYPIFLMSKTTNPIGQILIKQKEFDNDWNYYASFLDEFIQRNLIDKKNKTHFISVYKDPDEFCCLFVMDDKFNNFVFIPYPND